jgi:hypothetical protein
VPDNEVITKQKPPYPLQDLWLSKPAVLVGLISTLTGSALQEDITTLATNYDARAKTFCTKMRQQILERVLNLTFEAQSEQRKKIRF